MNMAIKVGSILGLILITTLVSANMNEAGKGCDKKVMHLGRELKKARVHNNTGKVKKHEMKIQEDRQDIEKLNRQLKDLS